MYIIFESIDVVLFDFFLLFFIEVEHLDLLDLQVNFIILKPCMKDMTNLLKNQINLTKRFVTNPLILKNNLSNLHYLHLQTTLSLKMWLQFIKASTQQILPFLDLDK